MSDRETAIIGLRREIKTVRESARDLKDQNARWRKVCSMLRGLAGLDDVQFRNLLNSESLTE
ncbi:hypothetical protein M2232_001839 [Bradyrhizobium japonicum]|uniref:hypothetical protein n=1 Tax=Bradyrhizobium japonicum TaxID=375 RepID=UPI002226815C|nr:hypothetical protein [Bradyrhizobium japonicum]MCW2218307.1 hypothetical protein [Bradyrhizobium japonicum]MCW2342921.1 hypothetical protein [Bradyrhizobium japonicum]